MAAVESGPAGTIESPPVDSTLVEGPATADVPPVKPPKVKVTKAPKEKKAVTKKPALHPTYLEMISEAIASLKERTGSSQHAISKFVEDKHKAHLPANFKKLLLVQLRKLTAAGKLTKVKNSYKIDAKPVAKPKPTAVKPKIKSAAAKPKIKSAAAKPKPTAVKAKKADVKPKPKSSVAKPKVKPAAAKLKKAVKSKAVQPKPKTAGRRAKPGKASAKATPSTKPKKSALVAAKKPKTVKKVPAAKKASAVKMALI